MATWMTSLITDTPQQGFELAVKLARKGVEYVQPSADIREQLRDAYENNANSLMQNSQVIATHYQTISAANDYWK